MLALTIGESGGWKLEENSPPVTGRVVWLDLPSPGEAEWNFLKKDMHVSPEIVDHLRRGKVQARMRRYDDQFLFRLYGVAEGRLEQLGERPGRRADRRSARVGGADRGKGTDQIKQADRHGRSSGAPPAPSPPPSPPPSHSHGDSPDPYQNHHRDGPRDKDHHQTDAPEPRRLFCIIKKDCLVTIHWEQATFLQPTMRHFTSWADPEPAPDLPFYALSLHLLDEFFPTLDAFHAALSRVEEDIIKRPREEILQRIFALKRVAIALERVLTTNREVLNFSLRRESFLKEKSRSLFEDVYDELALAYENIDTYHGLVSSAQEAYLGTISNRTNEVMKTLTIMATVTAPLTVITGIYGMNFQIPEIHWKYGYAYSLVLMAVTSVGMLLFFRWRKWI